jgi:hypothetical protein
VKRSREKTVQTAIRFPVEMFERLKQGGAGVSEEIRNRVARTFAEEDAGDAQTRELAAGLVAMIADIHALASLPWHRHPEVHQAVVEAAKAWLEGNAPPPPTSAAVEALFGLKHGLDPSTIGKMIALQRLIRRPRPVEIDTKKEGQS